MTPDRWRIWESLDEVDFTDRLPVSDEDFDMSKTAREIILDIARRTDQQHGFTASLILEEV